MGKNRLVKEFQQARMLEWVGRYDAADEVYQKLATEGTGFAKLLGPVLDARRKAVEQKKHFRPGTTELPKATLPAVFVLPAHWDYTVGRISRNQDAMRLEIRGYSKSGVAPVLESAHPIEVEGWETSPFHYEPNRIQADQIWFTARSEAPEMDLYLAVDSWGLLIGTAIVSEQQTSNALIKIHQVINDLDRAFTWGNDTE